MVKMLKLMLSGTDSFRRNNQAVFFLYIMGYMLMCFVFIYMYTNFMPSVVRGAENRSESRFYRFNGRENNASDKLYEYLENYNPEYCQIIAKANITEIFGDEIPAGRSKGISEEDKKINVITRFDGMFEGLLYESDVKDARSVTEVLEKNEKITVLNSKVGYSGNTLRIGDETFSVIYANEPFRWEMIVPFDYFRKYFIPESIDILVEKSLRNGKNEKFIREMEEEFGFKNLENPGIWLKPDYDMNLKSKKTMIAVFGASVGVLMLLVRFLMEYSKYEYSIYRLVGAKYDTVTTLVFSQIVLSNLIIALAAIGIYEIFYNSLFEKINMYRDIHMAAEDYIFMVGILTMFSAVSAVPFIIFSIKNSVSKCINYYG